MKYVPLALAGLLLGGITLAHAAPPPPPPPGASQDMDTPPPPPPGGPRGPRADRPPPPPRGASIRVDRGPDSTAHVDVRCAETDSTKDCAAIATQLLDRLNSDVKAK